MLGHQETPESPSETEAPGPWAREAAGPSGLLPAQQGPAGGGQIQAPQPRGRPRPAGQPARGRLRAPLLVFCPAGRSGPSCPREAGRAGRCGLGEHQGEGLAGTSEPGPWFPD